MKLNLVPQTVSKGRQTRGFVVIGVICVIASIAGAFLMTTTATKQLGDAQTAVDGAKSNYLNALATVDQANNTIAGAQGVIRDANLAQAMLDHSASYPDLYDSLMPYIPSFFRVSSMSAQSTSGTCTVTLVGTLRSYQQYGDLILALMRWHDPKDPKTPLVTGISRSGYDYERPIVPGLTPEDPEGRVHKPGAAPIPKDQLQRLAYYQGQNLQDAGYQGYGNYGSGAIDTKGAAPGESQITIVMNVNKNIQTPSVEDTLNGAGSGAAAPSLGLPGGGGMPGGPGGMGMPPGMGRPGGGGMPGMPGAPAVPGAGAGSKRNSD